MAAGILTHFLAACYGHLYATCVVASEWRVLQTEEMRRRRTKPTSVPSRAPVSRLLLPVLVLLRVLLSGLWTLALIGPLKWPS